MRYPPLQPYQRYRSHLSCAKSHVLNLIVSWNLGGLFICLLRNDMMFYVKNVCAFSVLYHTRSKCFSKFACRQCRSKAQPYHGKSSHRFVDLPFRCQKTACLHLASLNKSFWERLTFEFQLFLGTFTMSGLSRCHDRSRHHD